MVDVTNSLSGIDMQPKKAAPKYQEHRIAVADTGEEVVGRIPPNPKGKTPPKGNRLMWRLEPVARLGLQVKWNRKTSPWITHSTYETRAEARQALSIVTTSAWKLKPQTGTISRVRAKEAGDGKKTD